MKKENKTKKENQEKDENKVNQLILPVKKESSIVKKKVPLGLRIISIIYYIASALYLTIALVAFFKKNWILELSNLGLLPVMNAQTTFIFGAVFLLLSIISFFIARGLIKFHAWSRIALLGICSINIIGGLFSIIEGNYPSIINLVFNLIIASYLIFSKKVKRAFTQ